MTRSALIKTVAGLALVGLVVAGTAQAQPETQAPQGRERMRGAGPGLGPPFGGPGRGGPMGLSIPLRGLGLSEAQHEQVKTILEGYREEIRGAADKLGAAFRAQNDAVTTVPANESLIQARAAELAKVQTESALLHARVHGAVWAVLTPEQQAKATALKAERAQRMAQFRERAKTRMQERAKARQPQPPQN
jgi:Spy/CpxP family protein refolding chaperone